MESDNGKSQLIGLGKYRVLLSFSITICRVVCYIKIVSYFSYKNISL